MNNQNKKPVWRDGQGKATGAVRHLDYTLLNYLRQLPTGKRASMRDLAAWRGVSEREIRKRVECLRRPESHSESFLASGNEYRHPSQAA